MKKLITFLLISTTCFAQTLSEKIDNILASKVQKPFNGIVLISEKGETIYSRIVGYANFEQKIPFKITDQFVIGSISKQITGVLVLQAYERKQVELHMPIRKYLPDLKQSWADSVTVHHLLTHTHGIESLDKPLMFSTGSKYAYSQIGFELLARILEKTTTKSFMMLSRDLFRKIGMKYSTHPDWKVYRNLVLGYVAKEDGTYEIEKNSLENFVAAGAFISSAEDLIKWNAALHGGKLLADSTYQLMMTRQPRAIRQHQLFGNTEYGYGTTIYNDKIGQTGYCPGFVSLSFYLPKTQTTVIVLCNVENDINSIPNTFYYHTEILNAVLKSR